MGRRCRLRSPAPSPAACSPTAMPRPPRRRPAPAASWSIRSPPAPRPSPAAARSMRRSASSAMERREPGTVRSSPNSPTRRPTPAPACWRCPTGRSSTSSPAAPTSCRAMPDRSPRTTGGRPSSMSGRCRPPRGAHANERDLRGRRCRRCRESRKCRRHRAAPERQADRKPAPAADRRRTDRGGRDRRAGRAVAERRENLDRPPARRLLSSLPGFGRPRLRGHPIPGERRLVDRHPPRSGSAGQPAPDRRRAHARPVVRPPRPLRMEQAGGGGPRCGAGRQGRLPQRSVLLRADAALPCSLESVRHFPAPHLARTGPRRQPRLPPPPGPPLGGLHRPLRRLVLPRQLRLADVAGAPLGEHDLRRLLLRRPLPGGPRGDHPLRRPAELRRSAHRRRQREPPARPGEAALRLQHLLCQYLLIWYGNLSDEIPYYIARTRGGWLALFLLNPLLNWLIPFAVLLSRKAKRNPATLRWVAGIILVGRWLDLYLLVAPAVLPRPRIGPLEVLITLGFAGLAVYAGSRALARAPLLTRGDPFLAESLAHHQ